MYVPTYMKFRKLTSPSPTGEELNYLKSNYLRVLDQPGPYAPPHGLALS